jgi:hypothetical protein
MMKNIFDTVKNTNQAIHEAQGNMKIEDFEAMKEDFEEMKRIYHFILFNIKKIILFFYLIFNLY